MGDQEESKKLRLIWFELLKIGGREIFFYCSYENFQKWEMENRGILLKILSFLYVVLGFDWMENLQSGTAKICKPTLYLFMAAWEAVS
jgi:hypothetical protein